MGKDRIRKFLFPEEYVRKGHSEESMRQWRDLAEWLGIDSGLTGDAMKEATYYTCIKVLRESIGRMPITLLKEYPDGGIEKATGSALYDLLLRRPNPYMYATQFWASVEQCRNHYGNAYVMVKQDPNPRRPPTLWLLPSTGVTVFKDETLPLDEADDVFYVWSAPNGIRVLRSSEVLHFRSSDSFDGLNGVPIIDRLSGVVDGANKAQGFQNLLIANGMTGKTVLQYTGEINDEAARVFAKNIGRYIDCKTDGRSMSDPIPIPLGTSLTPLNIKLTDAQFFELKKYSAIQIASAFGIKPQQIGDMTKTSYASAQAQNEAFYTDTLLYIVKGYEEEICSKLLSDKDRADGLFVSFDTSTTLRASFETQVKTLDVAVKGSLMTPDEARRQLRLPSVEGGSRLYANGNLIPLELAGTQYDRMLPEGGEDDGE